MAEGVKKGFVDLRSAVSNFQEHAFGIAFATLTSPPCVGGSPDVGSDYPHSASTFPRSRQILKGVPDEQAKPAPDRDPGMVGSNVGMRPLLRWGSPGPNGVSLAPGLVGRRSVNDPHGVDGLS